MTVIHVTWKNILDQGDRGQLTTALPLTIGRSESNDIVLEAHRSGVSRRHATLELHENGIIITDMESTNGTFLNGTPITKAILTPGSRMTIGKYALELSKAIKCRNPECDYVVQDGMQMCPHCGDFLADAMTREFEYDTTVQSTAF